MKSRQEVRDINEELKNTIDMMDKTSEGEKKINQFLSDRTKMLQEHLETKEKITDGDKDLAKVLEKGLTTTTTQARIYKKWLQLKSKIWGYDNQSAQAAADIVIASKKTLTIYGKMKNVQAQIAQTAEKISKFSESSGMTDALEETDSLLGGIGSTLVKAILSPITLIGGSLMLGVKTYTRYADVIGQTGKIFGAQVGMSEDLANAMFEVNAAGAELDINIESISGMLPDIAEQFGKSSAESVKLAAKMKETAMATGLADQEATSLFNSMMNVMNMSAESAEHFAEGVYFLAEQNKVAPQAVMQDIANSSGLIADFGKDGAANIAQAAINAKKFGLNLSTVENIANKLLDFEGSIAAEMEASVMIGRNLNFNMARQLALQGDLDGAVQNVVGQLGGQEEFARMDVLQKRALADAIGISTQELAKYMNKQNEVNLMGETTQGQIEAIGQSGYVDASKSLDEVTKLNNYTRNMKDTLIPGMKDEFKKVDGVVASIRTNVKALVDMLGGFGLMKTMFFMGLGMMLMRSKMLRGLWRTITGLFNKAKMPKGPLTKAGKPDMRFKANKVPKTDVKKVAKKGFFGRIGKKLGGGLFKSVLKKIPGVGLLAGLGFGASRLLQGDWKGALGEVASGAASIVPGAGTALSGMIDAGLMARDMGAMGDGAVLKNGQIVKFSSSDDLYAFDSQRMARMGGRGPLSGGGVDEARLAKAIGSEFRDAYNSQSSRTIVTREGIQELTQMRGY